MDKADEAAGRLISELMELAQAGREGVKGDWARMKMAMDGAAMDLREALTPHGDPVFVQVAPNRRPYQCLLLSFEYWRARGCVPGSASWAAVMGAGEACGEAILEHARRAT